MDKQKLKAQLSIDENRRRFPYDDATGLPLVKGSVLQGKITIGVGRNLTDKGLSDREIDFLLDNDVIEVENDAMTHFPWYFGLDDVRQRVILNMLFNIGLGKLRTFVRTLAAVAEGNYTLAAELMPQSLWARQVGARATRLIAMMRTGRDV